MTREEKIDLAFRYCRSVKGCSSCPNGEEAAARCIPCEFNKMPDYELDGFLSRFRVVNLSYGEFSGREANPGTSDNINHPKHYELPNGLECIDVMLATQGKDFVLGFCLCNAMKYLYRHKRKNGVEDVGKARWYIDKYLELEGERER